MENKGIKQIRVEGLHYLGVNELSRWELILDFNQDIHYSATISENMSRSEISNRLHELAERIKHIPG